MRASDEKRSVGRVLFCNKHGVNGFVAFGGDEQATVDGVESQRGIVARIEDDVALSGNADFGDRTACGVINRADVDTFSKRVDDCSSVFGSTDRDVEFNIDVDASDFIVMTVESVDGLIFDTMLVALDIDSPNVQGRVFGSGNQSFAVNSQRQASDNVLVQGDALDDARVVHKTKFETVVPMPTRK